MGIGVPANPVHHRRVSRVVPNIDFELLPFCVKSGAMALKPDCIFRRGTGPIIAAAIHNGHQIRSSIERLFVIDERARLREEDPGTGGMGSNRQHTNC